MKKILFLFFTVFAINLFAAKPKNQYVKITTPKGEVIIRLYNETPLHRDNFVKLAKQGYFNGTIFHRVIKNFMIQGGDPNTKNANSETKVGEGGPGYTIPAEFVDSLFHKKGVLAAAREGDNVNPTKASSGSQFYIVQGKQFSDEQLDLTEQRRLQHKIPLWQREVYKTLGGTPHLDRNYTVFGEVVKGLEMVDSIANVETLAGDRPKEDVKMTVTLLKKREAKKLEKDLNRK